MEHTAGTMKRPRGRTARIYRNGRRRDDGLTQLVALVFVSAFVVKLSFCRPVLWTRYDKQEVFAKGGVLRGVKQLTQIIVGPNSLMQSALPTMLKRTPTAFYEDTMATLKAHAE